MRTVSGSVLVAAPPQIQPIEGIGVSANIMCVAAAVTPTITRGIANVCIRGNERI